MCILISIIFLKNKSDDILRKWGGKRGEKNQTRTHFIQNCACFLCCNFKITILKFRLYHMLMFLTSPSPSLLFRAFYCICFKMVFIAILLLDIFQMKAVKRKGCRQLNAFLVCFRIDLCFYCPKLAEATARYLGLLCTPTYHRSRIQ